MADQRIQCSEEMVGAGHPTKQDTLNRLMLVEHENDGTHKSGNIHGLEPTDSPEFVTVKLSGLSDGVIPYHVSDASGLADGPVKTDVDDAVTKKHAALTIDGTSPLSLSGQAISLKNDAADAITEVDTGTLANSDTVVPTSKAVYDAIAAGISDVAFGTTWNGVGAIAPSKNSVYNWGIVDHNTDGTHEKLTLGSDADGDMYYRASGALARLAKGAANQILRMNSGATAPEWGNALFAGAYELTDGATIAIDWDNGATQYVVLGATGRTVTFANPIAGQVYRIIVIQDGTGSRTITTWPTIKWAGGAAPTLSTGANDIDIVTLLYVGTTYYGDCSFDFAAPA